MALSNIDKQRRFRKRSHVLACFARDMQWALEFYVRYPDLLSDACHCEKSMRLLVDRYLKLDSDLKEIL